MVTSVAADVSGAGRLGPPALNSFLSALAETLSAEVAYFVCADPDGMSARSHSTQPMSDHDLAALDAIAARWLSDGQDKSVRVHVDSAGPGRTVDIAAVHAGSGELRGALLVSHGARSGGGPETPATEVELAAALISAVVDSPPSRQALLDWMSTQPGGRTAFAVSIDRLGVANEVLGFAAGDTLLHKLVERMQSWAGASGRMANTGGARCLIVRSDVIDDKQALYEAERLLELIAEPVDIDGMPVSRSASIGVAVDAHGTTAAEVLLASAVRCGAAARADGGNRSELFDDAATGAVLDRLRLGLELHGALLGDQLRMHYQPEFDLETGRIVAVEALLRWQHPRRGLLGAESFVPDLEASHTFPAVQHWVIDETCRQLAAWRSSGVAEELTLRLNVPGNLVVGAGVTAMLTTAFGEHQVPPARICVELTERRMPEDLKPLADEIGIWRGLGVSVALDDFGTGQGTLTHLLALPVDVIKIDQSFVAGVGADRRAESVVTGVIALAHSLGLDVVAEGIDGAAAARALLAMGCSRGQGNALAAAMRPDEVEVLLRRQANPQS